MSPVLALLGGAVAAYAGLWWPDLDLWFGVHRSGLTHGLLLPVVLALMARRRPWLLPIAAGVALGIGVHCAADLFPRAMRGLATIKLPLAGSIGTTGSYWWLGGTVLVGIVVPLRLVAARFGPVALGLAATATAVFSAGYILLHDEPWRTAGAVGATLAVAHPAGRRRVLAGLERWRNPGSAP